MTWEDQQGFRLDAKQVLTRMAEIMEHPAVSEYSWTQTDMDHITRAMDALRGMEEPRNQVDRLLNERAMETVEIGLYWAAAMFDRNGFEDAKGIAWQDADRQLALVTLEHHGRMMAYKRN